MKYTFRQVPKLTWHELVVNSYVITVTVRKFCHWDLSTGFPIKQGVTGFILPFMRVHWYRIGN